MNFPEDWRIYVGIILATGAFVFLNNFAKNIISIFIRATVQDEEKQKIIQKLKTHYGFWHHWELTDIEIHDIDFPSHCCGVPELIITPVFLDDLVEGQEREIKVCRKCLHHYEVEEKAGLSEAP
ncbi:MAG: hypothetical protein C0617_01915 [Desulfuromonas sp.]|uniref:hypothetical protein n=1 Tax=Desulfuromonas sp. TaxID=892 RepID=UPI000CCA2B86|nr:hypothetical protein [Desulfuromonas sp.]PLX86139.1 MAG: hypothetical protein C0617_01915 [Desulfuromonas sp.]